MKNENSQSRKTSASVRSKIFPISVLIFIISIIIYRLSTIGPFAPLQCRLLGIGCPDTKVQGYVAPEFIDVKKAFIKNFEDGGEVGSSVAAYYNGKLVVDLYGGYADLETMREYNTDTLQLMSPLGDNRSWSVLKEIVNVVKKLKQEQSESSFSKNQ
ncbi:beta-lactamase/transpeptidase-like protein [Gigaspora margarita]|uniref:Beta-lactamase/transpeptidase-like protein n=1 Tax=Gigaspora margarita TaxID=4874 RepID=A0A8H4ERK7_GIGMA|nr:beta-lactamase/transpeptidase-like protein [Gigaspora margarita]